MKRFVKATTGLVGVPLTCIVLRDKSNIDKQRPLLARPVDEVLSTPKVSTWTRLYRLVSPALFRLDPESAHTAALVAAESAAIVLLVRDRAYNFFQSMVTSVADLITGPLPDVSLKTTKTVQPNRLSLTVNGVNYRSPIGLSAGFDKNAKLVDFFLLSNMAAHAEIGSVSYYPWLGNPRPRLFRLVDDRAVINRMGLNNDGAETVANRLAESPVLGLNGNTTSTTRLGVNITKTPDPSIEGSDAVGDFVKSFNFMKNINGIDWITLNISCPNTAEGKTFEDPTALTELLAGLRDQTHPHYMPLHLKVAPIPSSGQWMDNASATFTIARRFNVEAIVIANTVPDRSLTLKSDPELLGQRGGLSGPPIFERSIPMIREAFRQGMTVVGVGGVSSGQDAYRLIRSGASLIQLYTAMVFEGPTVFRDIENELERLLIIDGFSNVRQVIGVDVGKSIVSDSY